LKGLLSEIPNDSYKYSFSLQFKYDIVISLRIAKSGAGQKKMVIKTIGYASLRQFTENLDSEGRLSIPDKTTVAHVLKKLGIPQNVKVINMINGRHCTPDQPLVEGDKLVFFRPSR
jgi:sulfur carrier protein ThiS